MIKKTSPRLLSVLASQGRAQLAYGFSTHGKQKIHEDIVENYTKLSQIDRLKTVFRSAFSMMQNPNQGEVLSHLGDTSSYYVLIKIREKMLKDPTGRRILEEKPRVNQTTVGMENLAKLPPNSFGYKYFEFMSSHGYVPEERPLVKHIPDYELAYVYQRYKEIHDYLHILLSYDTNVKAELAVKWFEMVQLELPSATLSAFFGPLMLKPTEICDLLINDIPKIVQNAYNCPFVMNIDYESEFNTDIDQLRNKLNIEPL